MSFYAWARLSLWTVISWDWRSTGWCVAREISGITCRIIVDSWETIILWNVPAFILFGRVVWTQRVNSLADIVWHHFYRWLVNFRIFNSLIYRSSFSIVRVAWAGCVWHTIVNTSVERLQRGLGSLLVLVSISFQVISLIAAVAVLTHIVHIYRSASFNLFQILLFALNILMR